jgi:4a-hydroxytetrahydrobiopterin dehydratase
MAGTRLSAIGFRVFAPESRQPTAAFCNLSRRARSKPDVRRRAMSELASLTCVPCRGGVPALKGKDLEAMKHKLPGWEVVNEYHLHKAFNFPDFVKALALVNRVGDLAEQQGHHPDILLTWGKVEITIWTHKIDGLTESDFILAAKIDKLV